MDTEKTQLLLEKAVYMY